MDYLVSMCSDIGQKRRRNEDCVLGLVSPGQPALLLAVADGMGGAIGGEVASRIAIETAHGELSGPHSNGILDDREGVAALRQMFTRCVDAFRERIVLDVELSGMGTTLTCLVVSHGRVCYGHLGDSRAYLFRDGNLRRLTTDHNAAQELLDEGRISSEDVLTHRSRNVLTRWLSGDAGVVEPEVGVFASRPNDIYLLCTDGLYTYVPDADLETALKTLPVVFDQPGLDGLSRTLVEYANQRGGRDNISVVLGLCGGK